MSDNKQDQTLFQEAMTPPDTVFVMPQIEEDVPMPSKNSHTTPKMTAAEELTIRTHTIKKLSDLEGNTLEPSTEEIEDAEEIAREIMENPNLKIEYGNYPNETIAYLAGLVSQTSHMVAKDLADIKLSVLNGLLQEAATATNPKDRISAWSKIGEIDGVDAFKRKTEVTHITKSGKELEEELKKTIDELKGKVIEGEHEIVEEEDDD
jgi:hypothetical protein